jgi:demethylmenaquinone methyltransferase/2-methoxy-6-polyprenyl-1,4-benzoquinol methylase
LEVSNRVWGIDISEDMIDIVNERFKEIQAKDRVHFQLGDAEKLEFEGESFEAVFCIGVLRYLNSWERGLTEVHRVLKPGGIAIMTFYYRFPPHWFSTYLLKRPLALLISLIKTRSLKGCFSKYRAEPLPFSYRGFRKAFAQIGFRHVATQHSGFTVFPFNRLFPRLATSVYVRAESAWFDSSRLGWLGSICIVKGMK